MDRWLASNVIPESGGTVFNPPSAEAFSEFTLLQGTYTAEYGRTGGGIEILTTKSGSNGLHGTWTYNMRRDIWEAAGWTVNSRIRRIPKRYRPKDRLNETGGGIGGPVWIPKIYNGRNKTFFYFSNDNDLRPVSPAAIVNTVPTTLETQGTFSQIPQTIYDPATTAGSGTSATRTPFPNNIIPPSRFSKISSNIIPFIPPPPLLVSALSNNHAFVNTSQVTDHVYAFKVDQIFGEKNRISYFQSMDSQLTAATTDFAGPLGTALGSQYQKPWIFRVNEDYTISPNLLLHTGYGYSRTVQLWFVRRSRAGLRPRSPVSRILRAIQTLHRSFSSLRLMPYTAWGMQQGKVNNGGQNNYTTQVNQGLTWVHGKHEFKFGWDMRRLETLSYDLAGTNGNYIFRSQ